MSDIQSILLQGESRLDLYPPAGRPVRMGTPAALNVGDARWLADDVAQRAPYLFVGHCGG